MATVYGISVNNVVVYISDVIADVLVRAALTPYAKVGIASAEDIRSYAEWMAKKEA